MVTVKKHKRIGKNKVTVVKKHKRSSFKVPAKKEVGIPYNPDQFLKRKRKKKFNSVSLGAKTFLFNQQAAAAQRRRKPNPLPPIVKGKSLKRKK